MPMFTINPTANQTPDAGQGGLAVTSPSNTGHASTSSTASNGSSQNKTCRWTNFQNVDGQKTKIVLKFNWDANGFVSASAPGVGDFASALARFRVEYSTNNGSSWTVAVDKSVSVAFFDFGSGSDSFNNNAIESINLPIVSTDQIQVRDIISTTTSVGGSGSSTSDCTAIMGNLTGIQLEVTLVDFKPIVMM